MTPERRAELRSLSEKLNRSFITCNSGNSHYIMIECKDIFDAQYIHRELIRIERMNNEQP